jgi:hypothetical protein
MKQAIAQTLKRLEDEIFDARRLAGQNNNVEIYGKLDNALIRVQGLGMLLALDSKEALKPNS